MGYTLLDQYSLLHFAVGVIFYFLNFRWITLLILHTIFEIVENTKWGMKFINKYFISWWPGGKDHPDNILNRFGDTLSALIGWFFSYWLDMYYLSSTREHIFRTR